MAAIPTRSCRISLCALTCVVLLACTEGVLVTVDNTAPRFTQSGVQVRAQDGNIINSKVNGSYALVGIQYGLCPYQVSLRVKRSHVLYNNATGLASAQGCKNESYGACGFGLR